MMVSMILVDQSVHCMVNKSESSMVMLDGCNMLESWQNHVRIMVESQSINLLLVCSSIETVVFDAFHIQQRRRLMFFQPSSSSYLVLLFPVCTEIRIANSVSPSAAGAGLGYIFSIYTMCKTTFKFHRSRNPNAFNGGFEEQVLTCQRMIDAKSRFRIG